MVWSYICWTSKFPIDALGFHQSVVAQLVRGLFSCPGSFCAGSTTRCEMGIGIQESHYDLYPIVLFENFSLFQMKNPITCYDVFLSVPDGARWCWRIGFLLFPSVQIFHSFSGIEMRRGGFWRWIGKMVSDHHDGVMRERQFQCIFNWLIKRTWGYKLCCCGLVIVQLDC